MSPTIRKTYKQTILSSYDRAEDIPAHIHPETPVPMHDSISREASLCDTNRRNACITPDKWKNKHQEAPFCGHPQDCNEAVHYLIS